MLYQLSYSRLLSSKVIRILSTLLTRYTKYFCLKWGEQDSNLRRHSPADLQSAPVGRFGISPINRVLLVRHTFTNLSRADEGIRTPDLQITNQLL
jgi:hypothetical protein